MTGRYARTAGLLAVALALGAAPACSSPAPDTMVATPGPHADPPQVVQALVDGINARDEDLVRTLSTDGFADHLLSTWFEGGYLTDATIGETLDDTGQPEDSATVMVSFTPEGADETMQNGTEISWAFLLVRGESGRWLVTDTGWG